MRTTMKKLNQYILLGVAAVSLSFGATSCKDYLDKSPDSDVNPEMAFQNFTSFQGFVEEAYNCVPNKESNFWCCTFNWGEDEIMNTGGGDSHVTATSIWVTIVTGTATTRVICIVEVAT